MQTILHPYDSLATEPKHENRPNFAHQIHQAVYFAVRFRNHHPKHRHQSENHTAGPLTAFQVGFWRLSICKF